MTPFTALYLFNIFKNSLEHHLIGFVFVNVSINYIINQEIKSPIHLMKFSVQKIQCFCYISISVLPWMRRAFDEGEIL